GERHRLQRMASGRPGGGRRSDYERLLMVTLHTAKRLQRIVACHICNVRGCFRRNQSIGLRGRCKILREQAWNCGAGNAKWPYDFRALREWRLGNPTMADL